MTDKHDYKYYTNLAITKTNEQKFDETLEALEKALELNPDYALAYFSKGIVYHNLNKLQAAYENYSEAIEKDKKMVDAYYNRAQALLAYEKPNENELKSALKDFEKAIELDEKFVDAYYYAAVVKKKLQDYKGAVKLLDKALEIEPDAVYSRALKKLILQKYM